MVALANRNPAPIVLIVEDEAAIAELVAALLRKEGFQAEIAMTGEQAVNAARRLKPDVVLMDIILPGGFDGIETTLRIRRVSPAQIVYLTGVLDQDTMNRALQTGPANYLVKPVIGTQISAAVRLALQQRAAFPSQPVNGTDGTAEDFIGESPSADAIRREIRNFAQFDCTVLVSGESGTGKELVVRAIHQSSERAGFPFVAVNCSALPESLVQSEIFGHKRGAFTGADSDYPGVFECAGRGTILLDEISTASMALQSSLLRILEERELRRLGDFQKREVNARIMVSTNQNLAALVQQGLFRGDLYYRINVARIWLPPLRERFEDVPPLAEHFLNRSHAAQRKGVQFLSERALHAMTRHSWPGNARELRNALEFASIRCEGQTIYHNDLPEEVLTNGFPAALPRSETEKRVKQVLETAHGNRSEAARLLGISRSTLYRRLRTPETPLKHP